MSTNITGQCECIPRSWTHPYMKCESDLSRNYLEIDKLIYPYS